MKTALFIGSNGFVSAIDPATGEEIWRTQLQEGMVRATAYQDVSVLVKDGVVYAGSAGHLFALEAATGRVIWHNGLKGLRYNDIALAMEGISVQYLQTHERSSSGSNSSS